MDLFQAILTRRTIRNFTGEPIPTDHLEQIANAGRLAASGMNLQPWDFIVVTDQETFKKLCIPSDHWLKSAGAIIAIVMNPESKWCVEDASAAVQTMLLAAWGLGYGGCWLKNYTDRNETLFSQILNIPAPLKLFTILALGFPTEIPEIEKKPLSQVLHWQRF